MLALGRHKCLSQVAHCCRAPECLSSWHLLSARAFTLGVCRWGVWRQAMHRIANRTIPRIAGLESPGTPQTRSRKHESDRNEVESRKIASESPSESHAYQCLSLLAHDCGYPLSRYMCRATRVAAHFLDFIAFCGCSIGVALHPLKILVSHLLPPPVPGGVAPKFGGLKRCRATRGCRSYSCGCRATLCN